LLEIWYTVVRRGCQNVLQFSDFFVFGTRYTDFLGDKLQNHPPNQINYPWTPPKSGKFILNFFMQSLGHC